MMAHPLALQLRNLQSLVEIGVDKNTKVVFPAPLMSTIEELGAFLAREKAAASTWQAPRRRACPRVGTRRSHPGRVGPPAVAVRLPGRKRGGNEEAWSRPGPGFCCQAKQHGSGLVTLRRTGIGR
jgi:hypothetical protein